MGSPLFTLGMGNCRQQRNRHQQRYQSRHEAAIFAEDAPMLQERLPQARPPTAPRQRRTPLTAPPTSPQKDDDGGHDSIRHPQPSDLSTAQAQGRTIIKFRGLLIDVTPSWERNSASAPAQEGQDLSKLPPPLSPVRLGDTTSTIGHANKECHICLETLQAASSPPPSTTLLPCNHAFHLRCISQWLHLTSSCPVCRQIFASN
ncbi:hypothetical protein L7F22_045802 [Adiantum nelumboides]|nr:hypothetical protein [Adiantum nelumboides]